jgi:hypothetical protein
MAFLSTKPFDLSDGNALNPDSRQGLSNFVQLEWLDDRGDQFHKGSPGEGGPLTRAARLQAGGDLERFAEREYE